MQEDDLTLLRRYVDDDDQEAFAALVRRHLDVVYTVALRRMGGDAHLAQDVAQEVFIALARRAPRLLRHQALAGWLYTVTRHLAANRVRGEVRRRGREQEAQTMQEILHSPDHEIAWTEVSPALEHALDDLGERDRLAILLRFFGQRTFAEVGAALRVTEDAARMRVDRALDKLHAQLARRGVRSSAALLGATLIQHAVVAAPAGLAVRTADLALAAPVSTGDRWLNFFASFRPGEMAVLAAALLSIGGAGFFGWDARQKRLSEAGDGFADQAAIARLEQQLRATPAPVVAAPAPPVPAAPVQSTPVRLAGGRRAELAAAYEVLYRQLGLTPAQIARFEAALLPTLDTAPWLYDRTEPIGSGAKPSPEDVERQLRTALGEGGYARYLDYRRAVPARSAVREVASAVYLTEPLSRQQGEQLTQILTTFSAAHRTGGEVDLAQVDWPALQAAAKPLLSPAQFTALEAVHHRAAFQAALQRRRAAASSP